MQQLADVARSVCYASRKTRRRVFDSAVLTVCTARSHTGTAIHEDTTSAHTQCGKIPQDSRLIAGLHARTADSNAEPCPGLGTDMCCAASRWRVPTI
eukprot:1681300-Rhodomonas_salina.1